MTADGRLAWFSPLPPTRSGVAAYSAELLPVLDRFYTIERFDEPHAHDFIWKHRRRPFDLVVYQLGNAPCHDYMWAYLTTHPGLVVLHDARLHQARAGQLLGANRLDDYRHEFWYDHPDAPKDFVEYAVAGMGGPIYYFWPMRRLVMRTARVVAVHNERVAADLRAEDPAVGVDVIRMGVPAFHPVDGRATVRSALSLADDAVVFAVFGKMTAEKRVAQIVHALRAIVDSGVDGHLLLVGDPGETLPIGHGIPPPLAHRVHAIGYVADEAVGAYLAAADVCLCLRWPTALETSASWLRCLAAARATVLTDLAHTADVPASVAPRVDLLDESRSLVDMMRLLAADEALRGRVAHAGHEWWRTHHTMEQMALDYRRVIGRAAVQREPAVADLPPHVLEDYSEPARSVARRFGLSLDGCWGSR